MLFYIVYLVFVHEQVLRQKQCSVNMLSKTTSDLSSFDDALHKLEIMKPPSELYIFYVLI